MTVQRENHSDLCYLCFMEKAGDILHQDVLFEEFRQEEPPPVPRKLSKRGLKRATAAVTSRESRDNQSQDVAINARQFTVTNLPVRPKPGVQVWERRNGSHYLRIEAAAGQMLPYGQDRLVLLLIATMAYHQKSAEVDLGSASEILRLFGKSDGGNNFERLAQSFHRILAASITWGTDRVGKARMIEASRMLLLEHFRLWAGNRTGPANEGFRNVVKLSQPFFAEIMAHPIPVDMAVVRGLLDSPAALDFYVWVAYRAYRIPAGSEVAIPLFGYEGLQSHLGSECKRDRKFREQVKDWIAQAKAYWPECTAELSEDGQDLLLVRGMAINAKNHLSVHQGALY